MSFPRFGVYKDSNVPWLGNIPGHWEIQRFKRLLKRNDGGVWGNDPDGTNDTIVLRSTEQTVDGHWQIDEPAKRKLTEAERLSAILEVGDLLLTKSSGSALHIGKTTLVDDEVANLSACYSNFMQRLRVRDQLHSKFAWYVLNNDIARVQLDLSSNSTTGLANLNGTIIGELLFALPPHDEQAAIVNFLDRETAKIDALITEQEELLSLLAEKRQATISHAVTKGVNRDVPMRDSGVKWLGEVPAHWHVTKAKFISSRISSGKTPLGGSEVYVEEGVTFLRSQNVYDEGLRLDDAVFISDEVDETMANSRVIPGDILLNITGASIGRSCGVPENFVSANVNQHVCVIRLIEPSQGEFVGWFFKSRAVKTQIDNVQSGAAREGLNFQQIGDITIALPPLDEQMAIVDFLKAETKCLDALTLEAARSIGLLKERRTALISAAVTGKIDVRQLADQEAN